MPHADKGEEVLICCSQRNGVNIGPNGWIRVVLAAK